MQPTRRSGLYAISHQGVLYERLPAVTSVLGIMEKPGLTAAAARLAAEIALEHPDWNVQDIVSAVFWTWAQKRDLGSLAHSAAEAIDNGHDLAVIPDKLTGYIMAYRTFLGRYKPEIVHNEATVYNLSYSYAGTLDRIYRFGDDLVLADIKTAKDIYPEMGLQLTAYRRAEWIWTPEGAKPMPEVSACMVLILGPDGGLKYEEMTEPSYPLGTFLELLGTWRWRHADRLKPLDIPDPKEGDHAGRATGTEEERDLEVRPPGGARDRGQGTAGREQRAAAPERPQRAVQRTAAARKAGTRATGRRRRE